MASLGTTLPSSNKLISRVRKNKERNQIKVSNSQKMMNITMNDILLINNSLKLN